MIHKYLQLILVIIFHLLYYKVFSMEDPQREIKPFIPKTSPRENIESLSHLQNGPISNPAKPNCDVELNNPSLVKIKSSFGEKSQLIDGTNVFTVHVNGGKQDNKSMTLIIFDFDETLTKKHSYANTHIKSVYYQNDDNPPKIFKGTTELKDYYMKNFDEKDEKYLTILKNLKERHQLKKPLDGSSSESDQDEETEESYKKTAMSKIVQEKVQIFIKQFPPKSYRELDKQARIQKYSEPYEFKQQIKKILPELALDPRVIIGIATHHDNSQYIEDMVNKFIHNKSENPIFYAVYSKEDSNNKKKKHFNELYQKAILYASQKNMKINLVIFADDDIKNGTGGNNKFDEMAPGQFKIGKNKDGFFEFFLDNLETVGEKNGYDLIFINALVGSKDDKGNFIDYIKQQINFNPYENR